MRTVLNYTTFIVTLGYVVIIGVGAGGCSQKDGSRENDQIDWKEMDDFHAVMADVYHPLKDSGNLEPIKARAGELAASASSWADARLPEKVDNEEVKALLTKLKDDSRELADQIDAGATDDVIQAQLTSLHDVFHSVQEKWYGGGDEPHQH